MKKNQNEEYKSSVYVMEFDKFEHNYDIFEDENNARTILKYSTSSEWTPMVAGMVAGTLDNKFDMINIKIEDIEFTLDYAQMEILTALIMSCADMKMEIREQKVISSLNV